MDGREPGEESLEPCDRGFDLLVQPGLPVGAQVGRPDALEQLDGRLDRVGQGVGVELEGQLHPVVRCVA